MMEYLIELDDEKKVQVHTVDDELGLILMQEDIEIFMS